MRAVRLRPARHARCLSRNRIRSSPRTRTRRGVSLGVGGEADRMPVAPQQLAHRRAGADLGQLGVVAAGHSAVGGAGVDRDRNDAHAGFGSAGHGPPLARVEKRCTAVLVKRVGIGAIKDMRTPVVTRPRDSSQPRLTATRSAPSAPSPAGRTPSGKRRRRPASPSSRSSSAGSDKRVISTTAMLFAQRAPTSAKGVQRKSSISGRTRPKRSTKRARARATRGVDALDQDRVERKILGGPVGEVPDRHRMPRGRARVPHSSRASRTAAPTLVSPSSAIPLGTSQ